MIAQTKPPLISISDATEYPVDITFEVTFDAFTARLTTLPDNKIRFHIAEGPYARAETVKIEVTSIRPGLFAVNWIEADGAIVVHVEDFSQGIIHAYATLPDGVFLRMKGPIRIISSEVAQ